MPWFVLSLGISRCAIDQAAIRSDEQEKKYLQDSATQYWDAVRWGVAEHAIAFVDGETAQGRHRLQLEQSFQTNRLTDVIVLEVVIHSPEDPDQPDEQGRWRTGQVVVHTQGYTLPAQIVQEQELTQTWYRTTDGWFVDLEE